MPTHSSDETLQTLHNILFVASGGAVGAVLRYGTYWLVGYWFAAHEAWGTLVANIVGSFLLGLLWSVSQRWPIDHRTSLLLFVGVLGAFTTFSTYALDGFHMLNSGNVRLGLAYLLGSNVLALAVVLIGIMAGRQIAG